MIPEHERRLAESASGELTRPQQPRHPTAPPEWRPSEQWVWERLCEGEIADFKDRDGKKLDPSDPTAWDDTRTVSTIFLETVLLQEPYCRAVPRQGVRIVGARFEEVFALEGARVGHILWLARTRFERKVTLSGVKSTSSLSLAGSCFAGRLDLNGLEVKGSLFMDRAQFAEAVLDSAWIGGRLDQLEEAAPRRCTRSPCAAGTA
jgi:hypothetical protein